MSGFWTSEAMKIRLPQLIAPYREDRVKNCSYEMSLGAQVFVTGEDKTKRLIDPGSQIVIPPGQFANLLTEETVSVPDTVLGLISVKFTLKQPGLVNVSGFHVDPGYTGKLLFSVYNAGPQAVPITSGEPAFLLWYCSLESATGDLYAKPPRTDITDSDVQHLGGEVSSPQELARRLEKLEDRFKVGAWVAAAIATAIISVLVGRALENEKPSEQPSPTTTSISPTTSTTVARTPPSGPTTTTGSTTSTP
jgi:dCTP deaminase